jgi:UDP-galactopyranose mutase
MLSRPRMSAPDVVCLSHVPWAFGLERPHQVMRRFARDRRVFFMEPPAVTDRDTRTVMRTVEKNVHVVSLHVSASMKPEEVESAHRRCVTSFTSDAEHPMLWVYSPSSLQAARRLAPSLVVYDCVEDHSARRDAPAELRASEARLLARADLVFTAGTSLFDAKRRHNISTYPLPSSVDAEHFAARKRVSSVELRKRDRISGPCVGFLGALDDRVDMDLVDRLAALRPNVQFVLAGGLVGVTTWDLPDRPNVHWLGAKSYDELPAIVASWDVAMIPFRSDAATRRTEPSGVLACMAAGKPIVATPLDELVPYAERGLLAVADADGFAGAIDAALSEARDPVLATVRRIARDAVLARTSWDRTWSAMLRLVDEAAMSRAVAARRGLTRPSAA